MSALNGEREEDKENNFSIKNVLSPRQVSKKIIFYRQQWTIKLIIKSQTLIIILTLAM